MSGTVLPRLARADRISRAKVVRLAGKRSQPHATKTPPAREARASAAAATGEERNRRRFGHPAGHRIIRGRVENLESEGKAMNIPCGHQLIRRGERPSPARFG
jgi:hypothetical protein